MVELELELTHTMVYQVLWQQTEQSSQLTASRGSSKALPQAAGAQRNIFPLYTLYA